jgi:hypothetical protein
MIYANTVSAPTGGGAHGQQPVGVHGCTRHAVARSLSNGTDSPDYTDSSTAARPSVTSPLMEIISPDRRAAESARRRSRWPRRCVPKSATSRSQYLAATAADQEFKS